MDTHKVLYKSKGLPQKMEKRFKISISILGVGGVVLILLPTFMDVPSAISVAGIVYEVLALLMYKMRQSANQSRLIILEDRVAGIATSRVAENSGAAATSISLLQNAGKQESMKFVVPFTRITDVQKSKLNAFVDQITITAGGMKYSAVVKDSEKAYHILCCKTFGDVGAQSCVSCGNTINETAEVCPHCGRITRYGWMQKNLQKENQYDDKIKRKLIISCIIWLVGACILVSAGLDLRRMGRYAALYALFNPGGTKNILLRLILGAILMLIPFGNAEMKWLWQKLKSSKS